MESNDVREDNDQGVRANYYEIDFTEPSSISNKTHRQPSVCVKQAPSSGKDPV
jgi:hypothetical protein